MTPPAISVTVHPARIDVSCLRCVRTISVKTLEDEAYTKFCQNHAHKEVPNG